MNDYNPEFKINEHLSLYISDKKSGEVYFLLDSIKHEIKERFRNRAELLEELSDLVELVYENVYGTEERNKILPQLDKIIYQDAGMEWSDECEDDHNLYYHLED